MNLPVKIASRSSPLALAQIEEIISDLKGRGRVFDYETIQFETAGDRDKSTPLTNSRDDFFTDVIDQALLEGKAEIAIHSAKDLPQNLHEDLKILALTQSLETQDAWVSRVHWQDLPHQAKVGTSSVLRQKQILQMRPDVNIVNIRGTVEERIQLLKEGKVDGIVVAVCALKRLKLEGEIKDIFPWEGMPLQGQLAVVGRRGSYELENLFADIDVRRRYGRVTLVGAGPGDCELITLKGIKALGAADCVFYDYLVDAGLLKYAPKAEHIYAGKRKGEHSLSQEDLSRMLKEKAFSGKNVVRLKGGDPLIFGRGADEIQYLRSYHIEVGVIPGISSATGIPSSLGIPLTARGIASSVAFLSGHEEDEDKGSPKLLTVPQADTLVFLMGLTKLSIIVESLRKSGWPGDTPMMIITNGTRPEEQIVKGTLSTIEDLARKQDLKPPALIVAGRTIEFYKPSTPKTFLHCGTHPDMYRHLGKILHWPMIDIKPVFLSESQLMDLRKSFESADIIVFTSRYAVESFLHVIMPDFLDPAKFSSLNNKIFAVIGRNTQKVLEKYNIQPAIVSNEETAEGLLKALTKHMNVRGKRILFPRSSLPNPFLKDALTALGAKVDEITIYVNTKPPKKNLPSVDIEGVIFTSPSTVRNFLTDYGIIPAAWQIMAKGPVTLKTLQEAGYLKAQCVIIPPP
jgi:uroporphyrinogen III methyltransferase / synthase